jgi:hypothetical protein
MVQHMSLIKVVRKMSQSSLFTHQQSLIICLISRRRGDALKMRIMLNAESKDSEE